MKSRLIIGLMSGTSLDGLDIALCKITGNGSYTQVKLRKFTTVPYSRSFKSRVKEVFAKSHISFMSLTELNSWLGLTHGLMILKTLKKWKVSPNQVDVIASHGQTVFHSPKSTTPGATVNSTFQAGDGDHLSVTTGIPVISDFRQKHIARGGEGAPLAVYGDYLLFSKKGENRIMLNIGGIGNFTYLPASGNASKVWVTDTGTGNTLIDQAVQHYFPGRNFDRDSSLAKKGKVNFDLLKALMAHPFFKLPFPKTSGPELFNLSYINKAVERSGIGQIITEDLLATLTRFSADTITGSIVKVTRRSSAIHIYVSGGGAHNPLLLGWIKDKLPGTHFHSMNELGIPGDAKEAVLFAVLANETLCGTKINFGKRSKIPAVTLGKISFPE